MATVFLRTQYNYDTNKASDESGLKCEDISLAQQNQKEEADINYIVKRFGLTGQLPDNIRVPQSGDFTMITDYHTALNQVKQADEAFMLLPADLRNRFQNNPELFVEFCINPDNKAELEKLGLLKKKQATEPVQAVTQAEPVKVATSPAVTPAA